MCGDLEEEGVQLEEFYNRFVVHAQSVLNSMKAVEGKPGGGKNALNAHLDGVFRQLLLAATDETNTSEEVDSYQRLSMEPLVLARIAGFMAAHLPLYEDPLRRVIDAMMVGYSEGEIEVPDHDHHHGHDHDHTHGNGHTH
ncbi:MAG: hypothetical protein IID54_01620 [Proteobacteria bacterium]|nr:hypothetical protein [Pseudomonadota bacterium]